MRRALAGGVAAALIAGTLSMEPSPASAVDPGTQTFEHTGAAQQFVVPADVFSITVDVYGAQGGNPDWGGLGARTQATLNVTPGQVLHLNVGGQPTTTAGGFNGGGASSQYGGHGGGGASDVRVGGTTLANRVVVAGGGGGAGNGTATRASGGSGGLNGLPGDAGCDASGGGGATPSAGGAAGSRARAGTLGVGGAGGDFGGGGGGGGFYGGGGGGGTITTGCGGRGGGGGGGASFALTTADDVTLQTGVRRGDGRITISWPPSSTPPVAPPPGSAEFTHTGSTQWWTVPDGLTEIAVDMYGAQGGDPNWGGLGGRIQARLQVIPGQALQINVGGQPTTTAGGFNGGGASSQYSGMGGGGASDMRLSGTSLASRVMVASGGGGAGHGADGIRSTGGAGGSDGVHGDAGCEASGGGGATQNAGGAAGSRARAGAFGVGGAGGDFGGGGGGGGYYGGGGGGGTITTSCDGGGGGGGGGASFANGEFANEVAVQTGVQRSHGLVKISWPPVITPPVTPPPGAAEFTHTGSPQWWTVPDGVTAIAVDIYGAQGGNPDRGGPGARTRATLAVTAGQTLQMNVGGQPTGAAGGFNGGGAASQYGGNGGGGASDIRLEGTSLASRVVVASGGGGAGNGPGADDADGTRSAGGSAGPLGLPGDDGCDATGGGGATESAGGTAGSRARAGTLGAGGAGGDFRGGGGGGGYYGGGGGGGSITTLCAIGGGGGGGSSYTHPDSATGDIKEYAMRLGHGLIKISWPPVTPPPVTPPRGSVGFGFTGEPAWWTVPDGVTAIAVNAAGAQGGDVNFGGEGGTSSAVLPVVPGQILQVNVGGTGIGGLGGYNGGGDGVVYPDVDYGSGGGGASDVRLGATLADRVVVAGGGGGAGYHAVPGTAEGGDGGGTRGDNGLPGCGSEAVGGLGASQTLGAALARGGGGDAFGGAGGGGGFLGGLGGEGTITTGCGHVGGGGGGGSGYVATGYALSGSTAKGGNLGNGHVSITWPPPIDPEATFGWESYGEYRNGVHIGSGNFVDTTIDADITTVGPDLKVERTYNSLDPRVGAFGRGWSTQFDVSASVNLASGTAVISYPDGRRETHTRQADGSWAAPLSYVSKFEPIVFGGWSLTHKDKSVYIFSAEGRLLRVADRYGRALTLTYDAAQNLTRVTDTVSGRYLNFTVTAGRITEVTTSAVAGGPFVWTYEYDGTLLTAARDARGKRTTYEYTDNRLTKITLPKGNDATRLKYDDATGKVEWSENGLGERFTFVYGGGSTQVTDPRGNSTTIFYDHMYRTTRIDEVDTGPFANVTEYSYDTNGFRNHVKDGNNNEATEIYDARGNRLAQTNGEGETTWYEYDGNDNLIAVRDGRSNCTLPGPCTDPAYMTRFSPNDQGDVLVETSPTGITQTTDYTDGTEDFGWGVVPPGLVKTRIRGASTTSFEYDSDGDLRRTMSPTLMVTTYEHDALGRQLSQTSSWSGGSATSVATYDEVGNLKSELGPAVDDITAGGTIRRQRTTYSYDDNGNRETITVDPNTASDSDDRKTIAAYDLADRVQRVTDPANGITTTKYDPNGNAVEVTDAAGRTYATTYDALDRKTEVKLVEYADPAVPGVERDLVVQRWSYDGASRAVLESRPQPGQRSGDPQMSKVRTDYDRADRPVAVTLEDFFGTPNDVLLNLSLYDDASNVVLEITGHAKRITTSVVDADNRVQSTSTTVDGIARVTEYDYDALGNPIRTTTSAGGVVAAHTTAEFDALGNPRWIEVENGGTDLRTTFTYDERGLQTGVTDPRGNTTNATYTETGLIETRKAPSVTVYENGGNPASVRPTTTFGYDAFGNQTAAIDARGNKTTFTYDVLNRQSAVTHAAYAPVGAPTEVFEYDAVGNLERRKDRRGQWTDFRYDKRNQVVEQLDPAVGSAARGVTRFEYDDAGNQIATVDPTGARTTATYDELGRMRSQTAIVRAPAGSHTTTFEYDFLNNLTVVKDATGVTNRSAYNAASELISQTDAQNNVTSYTYDAAGRQTSATDPLNRRQVVSYDLAGRPTQMQFLKVQPAPAQPTLLATEYRAYDASGNLTEERSARSSGPADATYVRTYAYDAADRLAKVTEPASGPATTSFETNFGYDANGNLTRVTNGRGALTTLSYNAWNLRTATVEPSPTQSPVTPVATRTFSMAYDAAGLPDVETQPGGVSIDYTFDELGRLTKQAGSGAPVATREFGYDLAGRTTRVNHPNGNITFAYDDRGLLLSASVPGGTASQSSFTYDAAGRMKQRTDAAGAVGFTYDSRGDLDTITEPITGKQIDLDFDATRAVSQIKYGTTSTRRFTYDDRGFLSTDVLRQGASPTGAVQASYAYTYDADGNVKSQHAVLPGNAAAGVHGYDYDRAGRLWKWTKPGATTPVEYGYDAAGNRVKEGASTFTYDLRNRLTQSPDGAFVWSDRGTLASGRNGNGAKVTYTFDSLGRQTKVGSTSYSYDGLDRLFKRGSTQATYAGFGIDPVKYGTETYTRSPAGELLAAKRGSTKTFVGENRHGDIGWYLNSANGSMWGSAVYDPWGEPTVNGQGTDLGYQGDITDSTTGDVWMGARWYDTATAGFTARDTVFGQLQSPVSLNRYTYAYNDPLQYFDPDGRSPLNFVGNLWDRYVANPISRGARAFNQHVISPIRRAGSATLEAFYGATRTTARTIGNFAVRAGGTIAAPFKACATSELCRTIAVGAVVTIGAVACTACAVGVLAGGVIGGGIGAVTCDGDAMCISQAAIAGAAGGFFAPAAGAGLAANITSGAVGGFLGTGASQLMRGRFDANELAFGTLVGGAAGGGLHLIGRGVSTLRTAIGSADNPGPWRQALRQRQAMLGEEAGASRLHLGTKGREATDETLARLWAGVEAADVTTAPNKAVFFSGPGNQTRALAYAKRHGLQTIGDTPGGQWLEAQRVYELLPEHQADALWGRLSQRYAEGASGEINAFVKGARPDRIWNLVERPAVEANPSIYRYRYHY